MGSIENPYRLLEELNEWLEIFDKLSKNTPFELRLAYEPLYEFYHRLVVSVGIECCRVPRGGIENYQIRGAWNLIKSYLFSIDNKADDWTKYIENLNHVRNCVEHGLNYSPDAKNLDNLRKIAPDFRDWILKTGEEFFKKSENYTFKETFYTQTEFYIREAEYLLREYNNSVSISKIISMIRDDYKILLSNLDYLKQSIKSLAQLKDPTSTDLHNLLSLVEIIGKIRVTEEELLNQSICPKCGGKIVETQRDIQTDPEEPPTRIDYRVGCEKCNYTLNEETIDI